jgi:putative flippase GtrA
VYVTFATELSILASFALNDRFTFRASGAQYRPWYVRCGRFQGAATVGAVVTVIISTVVYHTTHCSPVIAQGVAVICATAVNFSMHRFWTYRRPRQGVKTPLDEIAEVVLGE